MKSSENRTLRIGPGMQAALAIIAFASGIPIAQAADYGLGVLLLEGTTVLVPVKLQSLTLEPEITLSRFTGGNDTGRDITLGTGIYVRRELGALFESYVGGRVGLGQGKHRSPSGTTLETTTFFIAPTFGIQHFLSKQFSLGLDVGLLYTNFEQKTNPPGSTTTTGLTHATTRVLLRAYF